MGVKALQAASKHRSLPIKNQAPYIRKALTAGKHVLSEKPVAENLQDAVDMIKWYRAEIKGPSWCIAENWRFLASYEYGRKQIASLGRILAFYGRQHSLVKQSGKWYSKSFKHRIVLCTLTTRRHGMAQESYPSRRFSSRWRGALHGRHPPASRSAAW